MSRRPTESPAIASHAGARKGVAAHPGTLRFPCGHIEDQHSVDGRLHEGDHTVWVACRCCNLIAVATAPSTTTRAPAASRGRRRPARTPAG